MREITGEMVRELNDIFTLVGHGEFENSFDRLILLLESLGEVELKDELYYKVVSNAASVAIDIGHMHTNAEAALIGIRILEENKAELINVIGKSSFYYNLGNAQSNLIEEKNPFKQTFKSIERLVELKNTIWKALKFSVEESGVCPPEYLTNLGNALKQQFRVVEAIKNYDDVIAAGLDIPQAHINRSETLILLNQISNSYSIQMLRQVADGFCSASRSNRVPESWRSSYKEISLQHHKKMEEICRLEDVDISQHDEDETLDEFNSLSDFRQFCLRQKLTLSEHGLYCACSGSARDNLTIPTLNGVTGDFIIPMEMVLNRLKSEYSFARRLYYEFITQEDSDELLHESCFSELFNDEILGVDVEKLRTSFRLCFGVLDKIGVAICELYNLYPKNEKVYFQSFWQLDSGNRRELFERVKNPGLLALYSIATDLNEKKDGEWAFYKKWRNDLEHKFVVVHRSLNPSDVYSSFDFIDGVIFIKESDFISHLEQLLQITRSAIFSFVFSVRDKALNEPKEDGISIIEKIFRKDY